ncbi:LOB domain-containing protein 21 [Phtheirospermum japonicum]|uniref:LOB domain-containing protein 21 n=1 Tax=Phtheirospermum japonicum TaxID=374723 RepID=A0A830CCR3_9LAMI|nr:LOB domain-containing protein 21 [Phtheirospermum japonicum]
MYEDVQSVPTLIDWTEIGAVTSVKAQFKCSSYWPFEVVVGQESKFHLNEEAFLAVGARVDRMW